MRRLFYIEGVLDRDLAKDAQYQKRRYDDPGCIGEGLYDQSSDV